MVEGESAPAVTPPEAIAAYLRATHGRAPDGDALPPMFVVRPAIAALLSLLHDTDDLTGVLHLAQSMTWRRLPPAGARLGARASIARSLTVGGRAGLAVEVVVDEPEAEGVPDVAAMTFTLLTATPAVPGAEPYVSTTPRVPALDLVREVVVDVSPDAAVLYAAASGDTNPIHLDVDAAVAAGLDRPVLHGLCTLAIVVEAAATLGEPEAVHCRFARPVHPGQQLAIAYHATESPTTYAVRCSADRAPVLRDCVLRVRPEPRA